MMHNLLWTPKAIVLAPLLLTLIFIIACGGASATAVPQAGPTSAPAGEPTTGPGGASTTAVPQVGPTSAPAGEPTTGPTVAGTPTATATPVPDATATPSPKAELAIVNPVVASVYPNAKYGGILRKGGYFDPAHYDLMQVSSVVNSFQQMALYNGILRYNPLDAGKTIIPDLAKAWEISEDGKVWTFPLREGVKFHDGTIMTAGDVAASWSRIIDPPPGVVSARKGIYTSYGPTVEVADPLTVQFNFEIAPALGYMLNGFALEWHGIFQKTVLEETDYDLKQAGQTAPGTGAFMFKEYTVGEVWKNERFPDYWNEGLPYLDEVWTFLLGNPANRAAAMLADQVDFVQHFSPSAWRQMKDDDRFVTDEFSNYFYAGAWFNMDREPWNDPKVRRAIYLVIPRKVGVEAISEHLPGRPGGNGWTMPDQPFDFPVADREVRLVYDRPAAIKEAQRLMAEAGYADGIKGVDLMNRQSAQMDILTQIGQVELKKHLNIDATIRPVPSAVWFEELANRNFDLTWGAIAAPFIDPSAYLNSFFACGAGENHSNYCNPEFDALMDQVNVEADFDKRYQLVRQATAILDEDPPGVDLYWGQGLAAWRVEVKGITGKIGALIHNMDRWDTIWLER